MIMKETSMQNLSSIKKNGKETAADLIKKAKGLSSSVYSEESLKKVTGSG